jgi:hypothetical protein
MGAQRKHCVRECGPTLRVWLMIAVAVCLSGCDSTGSSGSDAAVPDDSDLEDTSTDAAPSPDTDADAAIDVADGTPLNDATLDAGAAGDLDAQQAEPWRVDSFYPTVVDPAGGSRLQLVGDGLVDDAGRLRLTTVRVGSAVLSPEMKGDGTVVVRVPALESVGPVEVAYVDPEGVEQVLGQLTVWSPAEIPGARLFDAAHGVEASGQGEGYEWQRLTPEIRSDWTVRDGNTTTWLPATGRFWMVAGWNGYLVPDGFSPVDPDSVYPPLNTSNEVWSSADGVVWELELPHDNAQFERRHAHSAFVYSDRLWLIGGDHHQGRYNHDVVSSADGVNWTTHLGPGAEANPPWEPRALQMSGVYAGRMWTMGGQDLVGPASDFRHYNDVWSSTDGVTWELVAADGPGSETRWEGCGATDSVVEFQGRMWLVGCARYDEVAGHDMRAEVWSTTDGATWRRHADPPWAGKIWQSVFVWDDKLWIAFGYTAGDPANGWAAGNSNELWYSHDGETWSHLPVDSPVPGSHAQGVAVAGDRVLYAGGNHTFGFGAGVDRSVWQLVGVDGTWLSEWTDRGAGALVVAPPEPDNAPILVENAFGEGAAGVWFDGSTDFLALLADEPDRQPDGRTILWVARAPWLPLPWDWVEVYSPIATIVGGVDVDGFATAAVGLSQGQVCQVNREAGAGEFGEPLWSTIRGGSDLQPGVGRTHVAGLSHSVDGAVTVWADGVATPSGFAHYGTPRGWSRLGGHIDSGYYAPHGRFSGTVGAILIAPGIIDEATAALFQQWAIGRFGVAH